MGLFDNPIGKNFGPYKVIDKIGRGGMAAVFRAVHEASDNMVALKVFTPPDGDTTEFFKRAKREVVALQMCSHPNILKVHGFEFEGEGGYVAVEYIDGKNLQEISEEQGPQSAEQLVRIGRDVGGALAYIHARGLFHRDLKPANIMVEASTSRCVLLDFGIVKATNLTQISGFQKEVMGTLTYMAPEQFLSREVDGRTDLYQLGLVLYRLAVSGDPPPVMDLVEKADRGLTGPALPVRDKNPDLPESMEMVIANCTHPSMEGRYATAHDLLKDLQKVERGEPVAARPVAPTKRSPSSAARTTGANRAPSGPMTRPMMRQPSAGALRQPGIGALKPMPSGINPAVKSTGKNQLPSADPNAPKRPAAVVRVSGRIAVPATTPPSTSKAKVAAVVTVVLLAILAAVWRFLR